MRTNKILGILSSVLFIALAAILTGDASAQGRYVEQYSRVQVSDIIKRLEDSSDKFRGDFDRAMDRSPLNGTRTEDQYNGYVKDYEKSLDRLRSDFDRRDSWWESRSRVQTVISKAEPVNTLMNSISFRRNLENQWNQMRYDLNTLADTYDLPGLNGGGWTGGPWNPGGGGTRPPSWAEGTWYWQNGSGRVMTIASNGQITVVQGGYTSYGNYFNGVLNIGGTVSTITRVGNNIRTYNRTTGETSDYSRSGWGGGSGWGNVMRRPPNWALGTWYAQNGSGRVMTIASNGQITVVQGGTTTFGAYFNGGLNILGTVSTITRVGKNIRTYNRTTGETSDYSKNSWGGGGPIMSIPPDWAVGNWEWVRGRNRRLTVAGNGAVVAYDGALAYNGYYSNGIYIINGQAHTLTRIGSRIRLRNQTNNEVYEYRRM